MYVGTLRKNGCEAGDSLYKFVVYCLLLLKPLRQRRFSFTSQLLPPMLRDSLIFLRALEAEDLDFLYALENDSSLWHVSDAVTPVSRYTLQKYLDNSAADFHEVRQLRLVICAAANGRAVGTIDLFDFEPRHQRAGVGIAVLQNERKSGFARAALKLLTIYARQTLYLHQLFCTIGADNTASQRLFEQAGFQFIGVRKDWLRTVEGWQNVVEYQCLLDI